MKVERYRVRRDVASLQETGGRVVGGDIIVHRTGAILLNCPACGRMQFTTHALEGSDAAPDIIGPVQCGSGHCTRCGVWFQIVTGVPRILEAPSAARPRISISEALRRAGVVPPPKAPE